ncbi:unnamed protein product, partial [Mesorhabditis spiculigera]
MECPPYGKNDPFQILEADLNDVTEVIRGNHMWNTWEQGDQQWVQTSGSTQVNDPYWVAPPEGFRQLTPPGVYYEEQKTKEIGSIVSLLQSDSPPRKPHENPGPSYFSPPHFQGDPMWSCTQQPTYSYRQATTLSDQSSNFSDTTGVGSLLPELVGASSPMEPTFVELGTTSQYGLAHHLSMPAMQPESPLTIEPLSLASPVKTQMDSPRLEELLERNMAPSPPQFFGEIKHEIPSPKLPKNDREFVMPEQENSKKLLVTLLETNNIRTLDSAPESPCETKPRPSGVALRVASVREPKPTTSAAPYSAAQSFDDEEDEEDDQMDDDGGPPAKKGPKTERRTAHNLIEKKYRCSINDRIHQMKLMLAGDDAKLSKSATLRRGIEYIEEQNSTIRELRHEIYFLRAVLHKNKIQPPPLPPLEIGPDSPLSVIAPRSPPSGQTSPATSPRGKRRARDETRLGLFAVMMAVMFLNPLSLLTFSSAAAVEPGETLYEPDHHSRVLRSADPVKPVQSTEEWYTNDAFRFCFTWILNLVVVVFLLSRLFIYGEPVIDLQSQTWTDFTNVRNKARDSLQRGLLKEAHRNLVEALTILERPLPSAGIETMFSITWQIIRHLLNSMWIGRWLARRGRNAETPQPVVCRNHAHAALVYHKLHQLYLLSPETFPSRFCSLHLSLSAVNLAESAGPGASGLPRAALASIYLGAALSTRLILPQYLGSMAAIYFIKRAKRHLRRADPHTVSGLMWTVHPTARRFLSSPAKVVEILTARDTDTHPFSMPTDQGSALDRLRDAFKAHLLRMLLGELQSDCPSKIDVADISQLLLSLSTEPPKTAEIDKMLYDPFLKSVTTGDPVCLWWTHVLSCALYWRAGEVKKAKTHYTLIRQCPEELLSNDLALAVGHAFCSQKLCIDDRENKNFAPLVAVHARKSLESLAVVLARPVGANVRNIQDGLRELSYEWILTSVLDGWRSCLEIRKPYWASKQNKEFRTLYQEAFNHYAFIVSQTRPKEIKVSIYGLTCRMLNGANPVGTYTALQRLRREMLNREATRAPFRREDAPDRYHIHVLTKLHAEIPLTQKK